MSSFGFNCLSSKLVGMLFGIVTMFVPKDFVLDWNYSKEHAYQFSAQTVKTEARYRRKT